MPIANCVVLRSEGAQDLPRGEFKVLEVREDDSVLMPIRKEYGTWIVRVSTATLNQEMEAGTVVQIEEQVPPIQSMSEAEIKERWPPRPGKTKPAALLTADKRYALVVAVLGDNNGDVVPPSQMFRGNFLETRIAATIAKLGEAKRSSIYAVLRRFFVGGMTKRCLRGSFHACGAIANGGDHRIYVTKTGRPNRLAAQGESEFAGFIVTPSEAALIQAFWAGQTKWDGSTFDWYLEYSAAFHSDGVEVVDGEERVRLKAKHLRPTFEQFCYFGEKQSRVQSAWMKKLDELEIEQQYDPRFGLATDGVVNVGQYGTLDLSGLKVQLVSSQNRRIAAGLGSRIPYLELLTGRTLSVHCYYGQHSLEAAFLALFIAGTSKNWLGERLGLPFLNDKNFPPILTETILVDHDEFFRDESKAYLREAGVTPEFPPVRHAHKKPTIESSHKSAHHATGHKMSGSTKGEYALETPLWNIFEFKIAEWRYRYYRDHVKLVPHLLTDEMRNTDVEQMPTRANIFDWHVEHGRIGYSTTNASRLVTALLPRISVRVKRDGVHILRPDRGKAEEFIPHVRYASSYLAQAGWVRDLGNRGVTLSAPYDPSDPTRIWLVDPDDGVQELHAVTTDPVGLRKLTFDELLSRADSDKRIAFKHRGTDEEAQANLLLQRKAREAAAREELVDACGASKQEPKPLQAPTTKKEVQKDENKAIQAMVTPPSVPKASPSPSPPVPQHETREGNPILNRLRRLQQPNTPSIGGRQ